MEFALLGGSYFAGYLGMMYPISRVADLHGRRKPFLYSMYVLMLGWIGLVLANNYWIACGLLLLVGASLPGSVVGYFYLIEFMPKKSQVYFGIIANSCWALTIVVATFYFKYISTDWRYLMAAIIPFAAISIGILSMLPESPLFLFDK